MTTFEQELIRAIEHGCPFCQTQRVRVYIESSESRITDIREGKLFVGSKSVGYRRETEVECEGCMAELWSRQHGWIPELKEVVESD